MNISPISFTAKIPIGKSNIANMETKFFTPAVMYEYDCKDKEDFEEVEAFEGDRDLTDAIYLRMFSKPYKDEYSLKDQRFYCMQDDKGKMVGVCATEEDEEEIDVKYIVSLQDGKHKFVGQTMLAILAKKMFNSGKRRLMIHNALSRSWNFYKEVCGFRAHPYFPNLEMDRLGAHKFIRQTEERTKGQILCFDA